MAVAAPRPGAWLNTKGAIALSELGLNPTEQSARRRSVRHRDGCSGLRRDARAKRRGPLVNKANGLAMLCGFCTLWLFMSPIE